MAKEMLGWEEVAKKEDYHREVSSLVGRKVFLNNNVTNRRIYTAIVANLKQEILRKRWFLNGEPIIIGKTGLILNGQHTLLALILAAEEYNQNPEAYQDWQDVPHIDKVVVFGVDESDEVVNTMDTCKPRSLTDVIGRSQFFANMKSVDRWKCAKICDYAVRMLWHRTGVSNAFGIRRTHSESLAFIEKHPKLLECVKFCYEEDGEGEDKGKISYFINVGFAAGLMYLMGSSASNGEEYHKSDDPDEDMLDWENWEEACDFWVDVAAGNVKTSGLKKAASDLLKTHGTIQMQERTALIVKAWRMFLDKKSTKGLALKFTEEDEVLVLDECPVTGGIDVGSPSEVNDTARSKGVKDKPKKGKKASKVEEEDAEEEEDEEEGYGEPDEDADEDGSEGYDDEENDDNEKQPEVGDTVWVIEDNNGHWKGKVVKFSNGKHGKLAHVEAGKGYAGAGKTFPVSADSLSFDKPE